MQCARQFVEDYLKKQVRFYEIAARCFRKGNILFDAEQAKAEVVLDASESKEDALVITSGQGEGYRTRYALRRDDEGWSLTRVQMECGVCHITRRNLNCEFCDGEGWRTVGGHLPTAVARANLGILGRRRRLKRL